MAVSSRHRSWRIREIARGGNGRMGHMSGKQELGRQRVGGGSEKQTGRMWLSKAALRVDQSLSTSFQGTQHYYAPLLSHQTCAEVFWINPATFEQAWNCSCSQMSLTRTSKFKSSFLSLYPLSLPCQALCNYLLNFLSHYWLYCETGNKYSPS